MGRFRTPGRGGLAPSELRFRSNGSLPPEKGRFLSEPVILDQKADDSSAATLDEVNEWGKRKLAYPINDEPDGYYTLYTFTSTPDVPAEVERVLNITDGVLRSLVTVK